MIILFEIGCRTTFWEGRVHHINVTFSSSSLFLHFHPIRKPEYQLAVRLHEHSVDDGQPGAFIELRQLAVLLLQSLQEELEPFDPPLPDALFFLEISDLT